MFFDIIRKLIPVLEEKAAETDNKIDDLVVSILKKLVAEKEEEEDNVDVE